jgi:hypothetical protein
VVIKWEEPPARKTREGSGKYGPIAAALRSRPAQWAVIGEWIKPRSAESAAYKIRSGKGHFSPAGTFEAVARRKPDGTCVLYARYVGEQSRALAAERQLREVDDA